MSTDALPLSFDDVRAAARRLAGLVHRTPVVTSRHLDELTGARLFLKCENQQKIGAFKARGALNAILQLPDDLARKGVVTHSSGNHGQAVAYAARHRGIRAIVIMPEGTNPTKIAAVRDYGGEVVLCAPGTAAREAKTAELLASTGATLIHPYNDPAVMAGQGTATLELLEDVPDLDVVIAPISGGGLIAGTATAAKGLRPGIRVFGAEPEVADDAARSLAEGRIVTIADAPTIADGLRVTSLGTKTWPVIKTHVERVFVVSEDEIKAMTRRLLERTKQVVEPSGAVPVAAVLRYKDLFAGKKVGVVVSGGNVDLAVPPWSV